MMGVAEILLYNNIPVIYSSVICTHVKLVPPIPSTASSLPCNTYPFQRFCITQVKDRSKVSGLKGKDQDVLFMFL